MCEYCDQVNCGILSLHNEFVLDSKGNEYGYFSLKDSHCKEVAKFKFIFCPICGKKLSKKSPEVKRGEMIGNCRVLEVPLDPFKETFDAKEMLIGYNSEELPKVKEVIERRANDAFRHLVQRTKDENEEHYELYYENIYENYVGVIKLKKEYRNNTKNDVS